MTDDEIEVDGTHAVMLGDGDLFVIDPDYLDPECEAIGVLAIQHSLERGQWVLMGRGGEDEPYTQTWERVGADAKAAKPAVKLKPVPMN